MTTGKCKTKMYLTVQAWKKHNQKVLEDVANWTEIKCALDRENGTEVDPADDEKCTLTSNERRTLA